MSSATMTPTTPTTILAGQLPSHSASDPLIVVRADAGADVGFGHMGRCLALWDEIGPGAVFEVADDRVAALLREQAVPVVTVNTLAPVIVLDRVRPTSEVEVLELQSSGCRVCLVDDPGAGREVADLLVDPPTGMDWSSPPGLRLSGFDHALIRRDVRAGADEPIEGTEVLLAFGAADPEGLTIALSRELWSSGARVVSVLGPMYGGQKPQGKLVTSQRSWPGALAGADIVVTRFGHTVLEAAHLGTPCLAVATSDRAVAEATAISVHGASSAIALRGSDDVAAIASAALALLDDAPRRAVMAAKGRALVDGRGAARVARELMEFA